MNKITYTQNGDYLIPDIAAPEMTEPLGKYGMMRKNYLNKHRPILYTTLTMQGKLYPHCLEIEKSANERLELMMTQLTAKTPPHGADGLPDKATDPMAWTAHMNSLKAQAEEVIFSELIYN